jgi:hypothetical protein
VYLEGTGRVRPPAWLWTPIRLASNAGLWIWRPDGASGSAIVHRGLDLPARRVLTRPALLRGGYWARNGEATVAHGWTPESGILPYRWKGSDEALLVYALGVYALGPGSPVHPPPEESYAARLPTYGEGCWGISASDGSSVRSTVRTTERFPLGDSSLPFAPELVVPALKHR